MVRDSYTFVTPGRAAWTTLPFGTKSCNGCTSGRIRYPATTAPTYTVSSLGRPTSGAYVCFAYLVEFFADRAYDEVKIRQYCPFLVHEVLFNSLLYKADGISRR